MLALGEAFPDVLAAARRGVPATYQRLYAGLAPAVAGYLRMQQASQPEALTSEVFLQAFQELHSFDGSERQLRVRVFTIAHHCLLAEADGGTRPAAGAPQEQPAAEPVGRLPIDQRAALLLRIVAGLTAVEVAAVIGQPVGAVKALQRRALQALCDQFVGGGVPL